MNELIAFTGSGSLLPFHKELQKLKKPYFLINRRGRMRLAAAMELNIHRYLFEEVKSFLGSFLEPGEGL